MAIELNIGVCKKIGLPDYGSAGSHCDIEIELDFATLQNPAAFQEWVAHAYRLCRESVETELAQHRPNAAPRQETRPTPPPKTEYANSPAPERNENRFPVSPKQLDFISKLSKGIR